MGRPCCCGTVSYGSTPSECCLYFEVSGFTGDCAVLNGAWQLEPYEAGFAGITTKWFADYPDINFSWFATFDDAGQFTLAILHGYTVGTGWTKSFGILPVCSAASFTVTAVSPSLPCGTGGPFPGTITIYPITCCRDCYDIYIAPTKVTFVNGNTFQGSGYVVLTTAAYADNLYANGACGPQNMNGLGYCGYFGEEPSLKVWLWYRKSSNQAIMRIVLADQTAGTAGTILGAERWYVATDFTPVNGGTMKLTQVLDVCAGGPLFGIDGWPSGWSDVASFEDRYGAATFDDVESEDWQAVLRINAPDSCGDGYGSTPDCSSGECVYGAFPGSNFDPPLPGAFYWAYSSDSSADPCNTDIGCGCVRNGSGSEFRGKYGVPIHPDDTLILGCCSGVSFDGQICQ